MKENERSGWIGVAVSNPIVKVSLTANGVVQSTIEDVRAKATAVASGLVVRQSGGPCTVLPQ